VKFGFIAKYRGVEGISCGLHRIERLMRLQALKARLRRRRLPPVTKDCSDAGSLPSSRRG
jgi:hypothetical protein